MAKKKSKSKKKNDVSAPPKKRPSRSRGGGLAIVLIVAVVTVIIGIILLTYYGGRIFKHPPPVTAKKTIALPEREVDLYLSDEEGLSLKAYGRKIKKGPLEAEIREAVEAAISDPVDSAIPEGTRLLSVKVGDKTAVLDFSPEIIKNHPGGSSGELQTIYSIVDTVALNFPEVKDVQILVDGKKEKTLKGHIDISLPLGPDKDIIKSQPPQK
ncbi:MAG: GerMN domain-containing protein [Deltaproteobacteria bacterium]|nr:GerMN domain-containing protein [Deltaproteobacteria bacterium]